MQADDDFQITVTVDPPEQKAQLGGANKYYVYKVYGQDKFTEFSVHRRYSDFVTLKNCMITRWPGVYLPALPEKKFLGNNHSSFVDTRRRGLQEFLALISSVKHLWYGDEFQLFIKNNISDVEKSLGNLGKTNNREISTKYETVFKQILSQELTFEQQMTNTSKLQEFKNYLKNAQTVIEKVAKVSEQMAEARRKFNEKYNNTLETFLPDLESKCVSEFTENKENLWFVNARDNGIYDSVKSMKSLQDRNALHIANELIKEELREFENFNDIIKHKEEYDVAKHKAMSKVKDFELQETKINAGKESIMSKIKSMNKEQQLKENEVLLNKAREELKDAEQICKVIDFILAGDQIERFKQIRKNNYYKTLKELAKAEKQTFQLEEQIWSRIVADIGEVEDEGEMKKVKVNADIEKINKLESPPPEREEVKKEEYKKDELELEEGKGENEQNQLVEEEDPAESSSDSDDDKEKEDVKEDEKEDEKENEKMVHEEDEKQQEQNNNQE